MYVIQNTAGYYLHKDEKRERMNADHGMIVTRGPFWTLNPAEALRFEDWARAEARAGVLFWDREKQDLTFSHMDAIKEIA
jgi:hypothetical protein